MRLLFIFLLTLSTVGGYSQCQWDRFKSATDDATPEGRALTDAFDNDPSLIDDWEKLDNADVDNLLKNDPDFIKRFKNADIPKASLKHANEGDFTYVQGSNPPVISRMKGGGHGQSNIDILEANNVEYNIVQEYSNGVRVGNVPLHKTVSKRTGTGQSWFPDSWDADAVSDAGKYVSSLPGNLNVGDGVVMFGSYKGVRVGVIKTNGKVGTIFPDAIQ